MWQMGEKRHSYDICICVTVPFWSRKEWISSNAEKSFPGRFGRWVGGRAIWLYVAVLLLSLKQWGKRETECRLGKGHRKRLLPFLQGWFACWVFAWNTSCPCPKLSGENSEKLLADWGESTGSPSAEDDHRTKNSPRSENKAAWQCEASTGQQPARNKALSRAWKSQNSEATDLYGFSTALRVKSKHFHPAPREPSSPVLCSPWKPPFLITPSLTLSFTRNDLKLPGTLHPMFNHASLAPSTVLAQSSLK